jgi:hypothetical protein
VALLGLGSGLVNPPLASTAVGVVEPRFAGMALGINCTFRQVGIATSVAALGSILATHTAGATGAVGELTLGEPGPSRQLFLMPEYRT